MSTRNNEGYSIIEILVYLAIFSALSITVINSFLVMNHAVQASHIAGDILENGQVSLNRLARQIHRASSVDVAGSTFDSTPGVLSLQSTDSSGAPIIVRFIVESGALVEYVGETRTVLISGQTVSVDALVFRHITMSHGEAVKIEMKIKNITKKTPLYASFYDTIIVQGQ